MTFVLEETSVQGSLPRQGIEIVLPAVTYRVATGDQDLLINGFTFKAAPAQRGEIAVDVAGAPGAVQLTLPIGHPAVQRCLANGVPPRVITVNIYRQQETSGQYVLDYSGTWSSFSPDGNVCQVFITARTGDALAVRLPTLSAGFKCGHVLYGSNCKVVRASFTVTTTVAIGGIAGASITVASMGGHPDQWAQNGELVHVASGERMTISSQVGNVVEMQFAIYELHDGDAVTVSAGCTHDVKTGCRDTFNNVANFGGQPDNPPTKAYEPGSRGSTQIGTPPRHPV